MPTSFRSWSTCTKYGGHPPGSNGCSKATTFCPLKLGSCSLIAFSKLSMSVPYAPRTKMQCLKMSLTWAEEAVGQPWESNDPFQNIFLGRQHPCISPIRSSSPISSQLFPSSCGCFCSLFDQSFFMLLLKLGGSFPNSCTPGSPRSVRVLFYNYPNADRSLHMKQHIHQAASSRQPGGKFFQLKEKAILKKVVAFGCILIALASSQLLLQL